MNDVSTLLEEEETMELEAAYDAYAAECEDALGIALARITSMQRAIERSHERNLICSVESRIKTFASAMEKCERRGYDKTIVGIKKNVLDVGGIRIITPFRDDIFTIANMLCHLPGVNVVDKKDYVNNPKENGYRSYHMHVMIEAFLPLTKSTKLIPLEIQIRDKAMDLWAAIEHIVRYKNDCPDPNVAENFKRTAEILTQFDEMAIELRDYATN